MLILQGVLRAATVLGGGTNKKTGELISARPVLQIETTDSRGLVEVQTITVPAIEGWDKKLGQKVNLPVRAWAPGTKVAFAYEQQAANSASAAA